MQPGEANMSAIVFQYFGNCRLLVLATQSVPSREAHGTLECVCEILDCSQAC